MAPVINIFKNDSLNIKTLVAVTAQHREMLDQVLSVFEIEPDYDLDLMTKDQTLESLTGKIIKEITNLLINIQPNLVLVQGDTTIPLRANQFKELPFIHAKQRPEFNSIGLFFLTPDVPLDPTQPWRAELLVAGDSPTIKETEGVVFGVPYHIPKKFLVSAPSLPTVPHIVGTTASSIEPGINWKPIWLNQSLNITLLVLTLVTLTMILTFQRFISRRPFLHRWIRIGFLSWILIWLGWYVGAQVTIIHILNVVQSLPWNFDLGFFLMEPLIFIIGVYVLFAVFLWGRAIFLI